MKPYKKVIILIMSSNRTDFQSLENTIKETWYNLKNDDVEILFYKERYNQHTSDVVIEYPNLYLPCDDGLLNCGHKTIMALDWTMQNFEFDYIYRSNLGAFVDVNNLLNFLKNKPKKEFYCGIIGKDTYWLGSEIEFASGSGYFLSKDLVELVISNSNLWPHHAVDDVALGYLLSLFNIKPNNTAIRKNICDDIVFYNMGADCVEILNNSDIYHTRLRSSDRNLDIQNMKKIYNN